MGFEGLGFYPEIYVLSRILAREIKTQAALSPHPSVSNSSNNYNWNISGTDDIMTIAVAKSVTVKPCPKSGVHTALNQNGAKADGVNCFRVLGQGDLRRPETLNPNP